MLRSLVLATMASRLLAAPLGWKEFSIGPHTGDFRRNEINVRQGVLISNSIEFRTLIGFATDTPPARILDPDWMRWERLAVVAVPADEPHLRLRTRVGGEGTMAERFRHLLTEELVARFHLKHHREARDEPAYTLRAAEGGPVNMRPVPRRERRRLIRTGWPVTHITSAVDRLNRPLVPAR